MSVGEQVAAEARKWEGTPAVWLGRVKGVGCDCKGLVAGVASILERPEARSIEALCTDYRGGDERRLIEGLRRLFDPVAAAVIGDVLLMRVGGRAQHLAIVGRVVGGVPVRIVHVHPGLRCVRETPLRRDPGVIHSLWRWRPLEFAS